MKHVIITTIAISLIFAASASGFDGNRKGFVLGGGLGFAPVANWDVNVDFYGLDLAKYDENQAGVALHIIIGGAFDEHNILVYEVNASGFSSDLMDAAISQAFDGAVWYHYFGHPGKSFFTSLGLGLYMFKIGDYDATSPGGGMLLGGGYEFARHWQIGAYLSFGKTTDSALGLHGDFNHSQFSILITGLAY